MTLLQQLDAAATFKLGSSALRIIINLGSNGPEIMSKLAAALEVSTAALTGHADVLEKSGLVVRVKDVEDRRVYYMVLTPAGEKAYFKISGERVNK